MTLHRCNRVRLQQLPPAHAFVRRLRRRSSFCADYHRHVGRLLIGVRKSMPFFSHDTRSEIRFQFLALNIHRRRFSTPCVFDFTHVHSLLSCVGWRQPVLWRRPRGVAFAASYTSQTRCFRMHSARNWCCLLYSPPLFVSSDAQEAARKDGRKPARHESRWFATSYECRPSLRLKVIPLQLVDWHGC